MYRLSTLRLFSPAAVRPAVRFTGIGIPTATRMPPIVTTTPRQQTFITATTAKRQAESKPDAATAAALPREYSGFSNDVLLIMANSKSSGARGELLIREIMTVDDVSWDDAQPQFDRMTSDATGGLFFKLPYYTGIASSIVAGVATFPLCFSLDTALWFNEAYVTTDVPDAVDLETWLEVGAWTWNWMEPPLGQLSFFLLVLNFGRNQMQNIGLRPYTGWLISNHCNKMCRSYPQYNPKLVADFAAVTFFQGGGADDV